MSPIKYGRAHAPCRVLRNAAICRSLVSEAVRALPQAKGKELQRLLKARSLKAAREDSKAIRNSQQHDVAPAVEQMPHDILEAVLDELDPFSLAAAACASRQWHEEASKDYRWQPFAAAVLSPASIPQQPQSWRGLFCQAAVGWSLLLISAACKVYDAVLLRRRVLRMQQSVMRSVADVKLHGPGPRACMH